MLQINLNIFLFLPLLVHLLQIHEMVVDSGATHHFSGYKEVLSNLVERESNLKIILGDNSTHPMKVFGSIKFQLNSRE